MAAPRRIKDLWREQRLFEQRAVTAVVVIGLLAAVLVARLLWLQVIRHQHFTDLAQGNRVRTEPLPAPRGMIYDRAGVVLAENLPAYQLELVREQVPDLEATLTGLVRIGLLDADDLDFVRRAIRSRRPFDGVPIRLRLDEEDMARFALHRYRFPGVDIRTRLARHYPQGDIAVHAVGYVGTLSEVDLQRVDREEYAGISTIGKIGVEGTFEDALRGRKGSREIMVNAQGRSVEREDVLDVPLRVTAAKPGADLFLTLDLEVQRVAEQAIAGQRAAIVALDPRNGEVLALASRPGFDPNGFARGLTRAEFAALNENPDRPLFNRALRGTYPPGSTIKPVVALAGLEHGIVTPTTSRACPGWYSLPGSSHRFRDWRRGGHGSVALLEAVAQSCDIYFYALATQLGVGRLNEFLGRFGLGEATGLDAGGEKAGILPSPEWKKRAFKRAAQQVWFPGETVIFGIGQGYMTSTPMQLAHMTSLLAMRGAGFRPRLVRALRDPVTRAETPVPPAPLPAIQIRDPADWDVVIQSMVAVMQGGTASRAAFGAPYSIAGKTGTAQVFTVAQNARYDESAISERLRDHAWFVAFAPVEDPRIAIAVLVENGRSGSGTAAPIARTVMDAYLLRKFPPPPGEGDERAAAAVAVEADE
jgi:penicillin-binding protein 2